MGRDEGTIADDNAIGDEGIETGTFGVLQSSQQKNCLLLSADRIGDVST